MWPSFQTEVPGKWVLAGEHAVLRGATAVALPHPEMRLSLTFQPQAWEGLSVVPKVAETELLELLRSLSDRWQEEGKSFPMPAGTLQIESSIPVGAGLGSSAAFCVALTRWMSEPLAIAKESELELATQLEHRFHGQSSGMDIAVVAAGKPISFVRGRGPDVLGLRRLPRFTFHDTGLRARTSDCILRVEALAGEDPARAMRVDEAMGAGARAALEGLFRYDEGDSKAGLELIARGMTLAQECFYSWELVPGAAKRMQDSLLAEGALAVKLTGAGGGGFLVALWPD